MLSCKNLEKQIEDQLELDEDDLIIFDNLLSQIAQENGLELKDLKSILYQKKSKYYETSGYINGKRISLQNLIMTFKKIIKKIFKEVELSMGHPLSYKEKISILQFVEYNMRMEDLLI